MNSEKIRYYRLSVALCVTKKYYTELHRDTYEQTFTRMVYIIWKSTILLLSCFKINLTYLELFEFSFILY